MSQLCRGVSVGWLGILLGACAQAGTKGDDAPAQPSSGGAVSAGGSVSQTGGATGTPLGGGGSGGGGMIVNPDTALPPLPAMTNVTASVVDDNVKIGFDPFDGARDYRVYALPSDDAISADGEGHITIENALYRCSGDRQAPLTILDGADWYSQVGSIKTLVDSQDVEGYVRALDEAKLGYVYLSAGDGRVPVYALGDPAPDSDVDCDFMGGKSRWAESRVKRYTTSDTERNELLSQGWRADGIAFYAPASEGAGTLAIHTKPPSDQGSRLYYVAGSAEASVRASNELVFHALSDAATDAVPLYRVFYLNSCGRSHDELVATESRFSRARFQGDQQPIFELHWAGIEAETTLVVEALAEGCPYQGFLAPVSQAARDPYPEWLTLEQIRDAAPAGQVYINGQHDAANDPRPIARSFLKVTPGEKPDLDWFMGFNQTDALGTLTDIPCEDGGGCWAQVRQKSDVADMSFIFVEDDRWAAAPMLGELWVTYGDVGADVNGKFRITPPDKGELGSTDFLYATMTVDAFSTGRRYPQILISDQDVPVQWKMENGFALVLQTFAGWPNVYQLEVCDHQFWDVNAQCPAFDMHHVLDPNDPGNVLGLAPNDEVGEHTGLDNSARFEMYASTARVYMYLDGEPYACADLPEGVAKAGPVTVTFGDVLYHSGVDATFAYTAQALQISSRRHYDNLGFKSHVAEPSWDESRLPCAKHLLF
jgi:hypothetical protein